MWLIPPRPICLGLRGGVLAFERHLRKRRHGEPVNARMARARAPAAGVRERRRAFGSQPPSTARAGTAGTVLEGRVLTRPWLRKGKSGCLPMDPSRDGRNHSAQAWRGKGAHGPTPGALYGAQQRGGAGPRTWTQSGAPPCAAPGFAALSSDRAPAFCLETPAIPVQRRLVGAARPWPPSSDTPMALFTSVRTLCDLWPPGTHP